MKSTKNDEKMQRLNGRTVKYMCMIIQHLTF